MALQKVSVANIGEFVHIAPVYDWLHCPIKPGQSTTMVLFPEALARALIDCCQQAIKTYDAKGQCYWEDTYEILEDVVRKVAELGGKGGDNAGD